MPRTRKPQRPRAVRSVAYRTYADWQRMKVADRLADSQEFASDPRHREAYLAGWGSVHGKLAEADFFLLC